MTNHFFEKRKGIIALNCFVFFLLLVFGPVSLAAQQRELARFRIAEATENHADATQWCTARKQYLVFYENSNGKLCMANVSGSTIEQSYGLVYSLMSEEIKESETSYAASLFRFRWQYQNNYDRDKGWATVELLKVYQENGVSFVLTIVLTNLDILEYKDFMEGSLKLDRYFQQVALFPVA